MRKLWLFLLTIFCSGCTSSSDVNGDRLKSLPHRYSQFDMALAWEIKQAGIETVVEGVGKNLRFALMEGIEIWVAAVDAAGKIRARNVRFVIPREVKQDGTFPFTVKLPVPAEPGMLLKFTYKYNGSDGGDGGVNWMQNFEWTVPDIGRF